MTTTRIKFRLAGLLSGTANNMDEHHLMWLDSKKEDTHTYVQCFPLLSLTLALGRNHVDYLSLDVEGPEVEILRTIPFEDLTIDVLTIEYRICNKNQIQKEGSLAKLKQIREVMGITELYKEVSLLPKNVTDANGVDVVFGRKDLF